MDYTVEITLFDVAELGDEPRVIIPTGQRVAALGSARAEALLGKTRRAPEAASTPDELDRRRTRRRIRAARPTLPAHQGPGHECGWPAANPGEGSGASAHSHQPPHVSCPQIRGLPTLCPT